MAKVPADVLSSVCSEVGALEVVLGRTAQPQKFWDFLVPEILRWQHKTSWWFQTFFFSPLVGEDFHFD